MKTTTTMRLQWSKQPIMLPTAITVYMKCRNPPGHMTLMPITAATA